MRDSRAGTGVQSLQLQDYWPRCRGQRKFFLLCPLRAQRGRHGHTRSRIAMAERFSTGKRNNAVRMGNPLRNHSSRRPQVSVEFSPGNSMPMASRLKFQWADAISKTEWRTYKRAIEAVRKANIPFLLGGG